MLAKASAWEAIILRHTFRPKIYVGESWIGYRKRTALLCVSNGGTWACRRWSKHSGQNLDYQRWRGSDHEGLVFYSWMEIHVMVAEHKCEWCMKKDPANVTRWKHKFGFHNRGVQWDTPMPRWAGEGKDWIQLMSESPLRKDDVTVSSLKIVRQ